MASFEANQCDRCRRVASKTDMPLTVVDAGEKSKELCDGCLDKVHQIMDGAGVEIPP